MKRAALCARCQLYMARDDIPEIDQKRTEYGLHLDRRVQALGTTTEAIRERVRRDLGALEAQRVR